MEKQELIEKWENKTSAPSCEISASSIRPSEYEMYTVGYGVARVEIIEDLKRLDEPQKVKVKPFVAEWFEENKHNLNFAIFELCEAGKAPVDLSEGLTDFEKWFYLNQDIETLVRMVDGYEVDEQLYVMPLPYVELSVHYCIGKDGKVVFRQGNAQKFNEAELDEYFPDIKHFAVKVEV